MADFLYYVRHDGVASGDAGRAATPRTGSFASMGTANYYAAIKDALTLPTTPAVGGDDVLCASDHARTTVTGETHTGGDNGLPVTIRSVDTANADQTLAGASEIITAGSLTSNKFIVYDGVDIEVRDSIVGGSISDHGSSIYRNLTLDYGRTSAVVYGLTQSNREVLVEDCEYHMAGAASLVAIGGARGSHAVFRNITPTAGNPKDATTLFNLKGGTTEVENSDFSGFASATDFFTGFATTTPDGVPTGIITGCKLPAGITINDTIDDPSAYVKAVSCDVGDGYHYFYYADKRGVTSEETAIYRTLSTTYDGTNRFSAEVVSSANASSELPHEFELAAFYIDTADYTGSVTLKAHLARDGSSVAYDESEVSVRFEYSDGADNALRVSQSSYVQPFEAVALTTETGLWTGLGGTNKQMSISETITIGTAAGNIASGMVRAFVRFGKASDTVFACADVVAS